MAGRVAPFIELGVGFNAELTARENVVLNGVMMGLSRREAQRTLDSVLDFAELRDFVDLKLKNYSSGMMVRLAFAVMIQSEADILLVDEVLAVGDAAFQEKCGEVFRGMRDSRTVVLVTHDMTAIDAYCDRAMLIHDGEERYIGHPQEVVPALLPAELQRDVASPGGGRSEAFPNTMPGSGMPGSRTQPGVASPPSKRASRFACTASWKRAVTWPTLNSASSAGTRKG